MKSESTKEIAAALVRLQSVITDAPTDMVNPHYKNTYTSLGGLLGHIRAPLSAEGLSIAQSVDLIEGHPVLVTTLLHTSGEWIEGRMLLNPIKNDPQSLKSAITYARRASLTAICGIAEEDDDGGAGSGKHFNPDENKLPRKEEKQKPNEDALLEEAFLGSAVPPELKKEKVPLPKKGGVTEAQLGRLYAISKTARWSDAEVDAYMAQEYKTKDRALLHWKDYGLLCDHIKAHPK